MESNGPRNYGNRKPALFVLNQMEAFLQYELVSALLENRALRINDDPIYEWIILAPRTGTTKQSMVWQDAMCYCMRYNPEMGWHAPSKADLQFISSKSSSISSAYESIFWTSESADNTAWAVFTGKCWSVSSEELSKKYKFDALPIIKIKKGS